MKALARPTKTTRLDELGFVSRGRSRHRPRYDASLYGGEYPFFQTGDIKAANLYLTEYSQTYSEAGLVQSKMWDKGTLCITIAANIAETAILGIPGCFPDSVVGFVPDPEKADVRFIKYYIDILKIGMQSISRGTTQDNMSVEKLMSFDFNVPDLPTQRKIAGILSAYDDLIANNLRRIKILEKMAQSLYREWFVNFRFPGHESAKFVDSAIGQIPKGWEVKTLDELTEVILDCRGKTPKKLGGDWSDEGIVALSALNVKTGHLIKMDQAKTLSEELYSKWMKTPLKRHDILLTSEAPLGECYLLPDDTRYCLSQRLFALRANPKMISAALLFYSLISQQGQARLQNRATGTTVRGIRQAALREVEILVPHQKIRELAGAFFDGTAAQLANLQRRNQILRRTRDLLLPKLLSGG